MNETIGASLREAREKRQLTLQQASDIIKVRPHYLQALENDDLSAIPSAAQARGFLRIYAEFLGLQVADLLPHDSAPVPAPAAESLPAPKPTIPASPKAPASSLLDTLRSLLAHLGKREAPPATPQSEVVAESRGNGSAARVPAEETPDTGKKKVSQ